MDELWVIGWVQTAMTVAMDACYTEPSQNNHLSATEHD
jgi:hypothetical protein